MRIRSFLGSDYRDCHVNLPHIIRWTCPRLRSSCGCHLFLYEDGNKTRKNAENIRVSTKRKKEAFSFFGRIFLTFLKLEFKLLALLHLYYLLVLRFFKIQRFSKFRDFQNSEIFKIQRFSNFVNLCSRSYFVKFQPSFLCFPDKLDRLYSTVDLAHF